MADEQPLGDARTDEFGDWLTIAEAAERLDVSGKTIRRRLRAGELAGEMVHDPAIGANRWLIDPASLPQTSTSAALIPVELLDRLSDAYKDAAEANARAEVAERVVDFEKERRKTAETEAAIEKTGRSTAEFVAKIEKEGREKVEAERAETLADLAELRIRYEGLRDEKRGRHEAEAARDSVMDAHDRYRETTGAELAELRIKYAGLRDKRWWQRRPE